MVSAQSNDIIDDILAEEEMTYGSAAYLLLLAIGELDETADRAEAVTRFRQLDSGLEIAGGTVVFQGASARFRRVGEVLNYPPVAALTLGEYALLVMQTFEISGGFMYSLTPSPRYAARELAFRRAIQGRSFPRMSISGERGMRILGRILALQEEGAL
ncbi:MAG: hypothetical protein MI724_18240 [Spirochaetales bacterium]|nr:hypothetical protein [Spirochaetales bacterium]